MREKVRRLPPLEWNRRFLPHYFGRYAPADFHAHISADLDGLHLRRGARLSYIAPRGGAKSTFCTLGYPLRAALEGWEPYTLILSDSSDQADELLRHIRTELETNELLAAVYPGAAGAGPEWSGSRIRLRNGALVAALGTGKKVRGRRNRSERPSLVIFDDIQSNEDVGSPTLRARAWAWATREVIPAGDERTNYLSVGSALHPDAVAVKLQTLPRWVGRTFPAVHAWPDRMDLWDEFLRVAGASAGEDKVGRAMAFYAARRAEMDAGAAVFWPARFGIVDMILKRAEIGAHAFSAEYQGVASVAENAEWPAEWLAGEDLWFDAWPESGVQWSVQSLDPSKGTDGLGKDYQAHVQLAACIEGGRWVYYVDADLQREGVVPMVERAVRWAQALHRATNRPVDSLIVEDNATMGLLPAQLQATCARLNYAANWTCRTATENKNQRIMAWVGPPLSRRQIRFRRTPGAKMLVGQCQSWPGTEHDDGIDALATAIKRVSELMLQ